MKILRLESENVKRLVAVEIKPEGNLVELTGKNGSGKTSILDSIQWAIEGARHIQSQPIRKGQREARIKLDLGEVIVTRRFSKRDDGSTDTSVIVEGANGARFPSPQKMLDSFLGALTFDPLAFARSDAKQQFNELRRFVPDVDFDAIDGLNRKDFETRTTVNRQEKEARGAAAQIVVPDGTPAESIDDAALVAELEKAGEHNAAIERERANRTAQVQTMEGKFAAADRARSEAKRLRAQAALKENEAGIAEAAGNEIKTRLEVMEAVKEAIDTSVVRAKIAEAKKTNKAVEESQRRGACIERANNLKADSKRLTDQIDARNLSKAKTIAEAKLPIDGLGFGDGFVTLSGVPFEQASDAEQLRASVAIAMAGNPKLRVIRIRDGSLLDSDGMKLLAQMADERDMQVWIERVASDGKVGFVISDGLVVSNPNDERDDLASEFPTPVEAVEMVRA